MVLRKKTFVYKRFGYHFPAVQITVLTKSQGTQCTLLKEMFLTSTPCASADEPSDSEEEMDADDDSSYVPKPEDEMDEDGDFADFDQFDWSLFGRTCIINLNNIGNCHSGQIPGV